VSFLVHSLAALLLMAAPAPREQTLQGIRFVSLFPNGADPTSPLIVAIHGRGDTPQNFADVFAGFPGKAQIALPQAPIAFGPGWSWFDGPPASSEDALAANIGAQEEKLWKGIAELAKGRKVIVMGFSQGGMLAYVLAARHPDQISASFPIAGAAPSKLLPREGSKSTPVLAMHGTTDAVIEIAHGRSAVAGFKKAGWNAQLREYPGVGHTITQKMREDLFGRIVEVMNKPPK
jgi:phospholipase/carboxylesterase